MDLMELITNLTSGMKPNDAVMNAQGAVPPGGGAPAGPPQGPPPGPSGVQTPVTNPIADGKAPQAYQSPADLSNMYLELMRKNQNAAALDSGLTTIAAGFSKYPENRAALLRSAGAGGSGAGGITSADLINLQKQDQANRDMLVRRQALPALRKQYNMTDAQIQFLERSGKLDEVLQNFATRSLAHITDANGQVHLVDDRGESGGGGKGKNRIIATIGSEKEDPTEYVTGPNGPELRNKRTGEIVGAPVGAPPDNQFVAGPKGQELRDKRTGAPVGDPIGLAPTNIKQQFDEFNAARAAEGKPPMTADEFLKLVHPGQTINVGNKENFPHVKPETGQDYVRNADGTIKYDAEGKPTLYNIKGGDPALKAEVTAKETVEKEKKERIAKSQTAFAASNVGRAVSKAFEEADKPGATGFLSRPARSLGLGGMPSDTLDSALKTIDANTAFTQLRAMRESSASGASGLGQLTEKEGQMLSSVIDNIGPFQATGSFKDGLARIEAAMTLLAGDSFGEGADIARFNRELNDMSQQILAREHNKRSSGSKVRVVPR